MVSYLPTLFGAPQSVRRGGGRGNVADTTNVRDNAAQMFVVPPARDSTALDNEAVNAIEMRLQLL